MLWKIGQSFWTKIFKNKAKIAPDTHLNTWASRALKRALEICRKDYALVKRALHAEHTIFNIENTIF